jgi:hypothetical protein
MKNWCFSGVKGTPFQMKLVFKTDIFLVTLTTKIFVFELIQVKRILGTDYFSLKVANKFVIEIKQYMVDFTY